MLGRNLSNALCKPEKLSTEEVLLNVEDLSSNTYTADVNGVTQTFTLPNL